MSEFTHSAIAALNASMEKHAGIAGLETFQAGNFTAEQLAAVKERYTFKVYGGTHAIAGGNVLERPSPREYVSARSVAESLDARRGDKLFVECLGYSARRGIIPQPVIDAPDSKKRDVAEELMKDNKLDAFTYAAAIACAQGVEVLHADINHRVRDTISHLLGGVDIYQLLINNNNDEFKQAPDIHTIRVLQATRIAVHHAIESLPSIGENEPVYATLYGEEHVTGEKAGLTLPEAYKELGIEPEVTSLPNSLAERIVAQLLMKVSGSFSRPVQS